MLGALIVVAVAVVVVVVVVVLAVLIVVLLVIVGLVYKPLDSYVPQEKDNVNNKSKS